MKIYRCEDFKRIELDGFYDIKKRIDLISKSEVRNILNACNYNEETLKNWINLIGVNCESVKILDEAILFTVNNKELMISRLSSGERMILYIIACKKLNKKLVIHSLFERLGKRLRNVLDDVAYDYENLVVILYNTGVTDKLKKYIVEVPR